jgi:hypothetical protein
MFRPHENHSQALRCSTDSDSDAGDRELAFLQPFRGVRSNAVFLERFSGIESAHLDLFFESRESLKIIPAKSM